MSVKSKRRARKRQLAERAKADSVPGVGATSENGETFTLNSILADFRANKELEQAAEGIKPVKDADMDFADIPEPGEAVAPEPPEIAEPSEIVERLSYLFAADEGAERPADEPTEHLTVDEPAQRLPDISKADEMPEYVSETFSTEEAAERFFDQFMADEAATEAPTMENVTATPTTETVAEAPTTETFTETASEAVAAETLSGTVTESVTATPTTEAVAGTISETVAEAVTEAPTMENVTETASEAVAETPSGTVTEAVSADAAEDLSDTRTFPRMRDKTASPPTFWKRIFGRSKPAKNVREADAAEPRSVSLEEVVGNTVDAVKADAMPKRSLFSRRRLEDAGDELPEPAHTEVIGPEPDLKTAAEEARKEYVKRVEGLRPALIPALLPLLVLSLEALGLRLPFLTGGAVLRPLLLLGCLCVTLWLCRSVFTDNRCTATFLCGVSGVAAALDCVTMPFLSGRSMAEPYGAVACLALLAAKLGSSLESHGTYDTFHAAALDRNPPYLVTDTVYGTCKRRGSVTGFYTAALAQNFSTRWQMFSMPVTLAASLSLRRSVRWESSAAATSS